jgi:hypothetical protein
VLKVQYRNKSAIPEEEISPEQAKTDEDEMVNQTAIEQEK